MVVVDAPVGLFVVTLEFRVVGYEVGFRVEMLEIGVDAVVGFVVRRVVEIEAVLFSVFPQFLHVPLIYSCPFIMHQVFRLVVALVV